MFTLERATRTILPEVQVYARSHVCANPMWLSCGSGAILHDYLGQWDSLTCLQVRIMNSRDNWGNTCRALATSHDNCLVGPRSGLSRMPMECSVHGVAKLSRKTARPLPSYTLMCGKFSNLECVK